MGVSHRGHADGGVTIDFRSGIRTMHTFKKLPMISPNRSTEMLINVEGATKRICHIHPVLSSRHLASDARLLTQPGFLFR
jgi:hypothetical protein